MTTNSSSTRARTSSANRSPDRAQLERELTQALDAGSEAVHQQVRYILALSQLNAAKSNRPARPEPEYTIGQARLQALVETAPALTDTQIQTLFKDIQAIHDDRVRLPLVLRIALRLHPDDYRLTMHLTWKQAQSIDDPVIRSHILLKLAPLLSLADDEPATPTALLDVIALAQSISSIEARVRSLVALVPYLPHTVGARLINRALYDITHAGTDHLRANTLTTIATYVPEGVEQAALDTALAIKAPVQRARALNALAHTLPDAFQAQIREATLETISLIEKEEDSAEALIDFVPHLDVATSDEQYPQILEKALEIALKLTRRSLRAQTLVALAPNLTHDLQGEVLAIVHSLESEHTRAGLLGELAPYLKQDLLIATLGLANTLQEQDARVHILTTLARYVPEHLRAQALLDALAAASNLPNHYERVTALVSLLDILPAPQQEQALANALETVRLMTNENARARALGLLSQTLPDNMIPRTEEVVYQIEDTQQRINALMALLPRFPVDNQRHALEHILDSAEGMPFDYKRTRALISVAPHLTDDLRARALGMADRLADPFDRTSAYIALAQNLPPEERPQVIRQAWELVMQIEDGYDRASALAAIAPFLPDEMKGGLSGAAGMVIGAIMDEYDQASAITILAPLLAGASDDKANEGEKPDYITAFYQAVHAIIDIPHPTWRVAQLKECIPLWEELDAERRFDLWTQISPRLANLPLAEAIDCLGTLTPVLEAIGGPDTQRNIARVLGMR